MAQYLEASASFAFATDSSKADTLASRSFSMSDTANFDEQSVQLLDVPTGTTDQAIALGPLTAIKALFVRSDRQVTIKLANTHEVTLGHTAAEGGFLVLSATDFGTGLQVTNQSGDTAKLYVAMFGT